MNVYLLNELRGHTLHFLVTLLCPHPVVSSVCTASSALWPGWRLAGRTWGTSKRRWGDFCTLTPSTRHSGTAAMGTLARPSLPLMVQWRWKRLTPRTRDAMAHSGTGKLKRREGWVVWYNQCRNVLFKIRRLFFLLFPSSVFYYAYYATM